MTMNPTMLPYGAAEILALRKTGKRPADMILLSLIGPLRGENNPVIVANPTRRYDWRILLDLEVLVIASSATDTTTVKRLLDELKALPTRYLGLWLSDRQNGLHVVVDGVPAHPRGLLRYMSRAERQNFHGIGQHPEYRQCA
ncbi:hypothetical protein [Azonexus sp. IMCC34839]|uniref:hypothetical protein n=1 Tax=Azonexus sp. IMCC34839 TaxID=3133695 RepID=UPI003999EA5E